jgi:PBP1b-binding outer membrane lipoprotein LpoB
MKRILQVLVLAMVFSSCVYPEQEAALAAAKKKQEEAHCKLDLAKSILENGMNTMQLATQVGLKKQVDNFNKMQSDSNISCDSLKKACDNLSDLTSKKSQ